MSATVSAIHPTAPAHRSRLRRLTLVSALLFAMCLLAWSVHRILMPMPADQLHRLAAEVQAGSLALKSLQQLEQPLVQTLSEQLEPAHTRVLLRELLEGLLHHPAIVELRYSWQADSAPQQQTPLDTVLAERLARLLAREMPSLTINEALSLVHTLQADWYHSTLQLQLMLRNEAVVPKVLQQLLRLPAVAMQARACTLAQIPVNENVGKESQSAVNFECELQLQQLLPADGLQLWLDDNGVDRHRPQVTLRASDYSDLGDLSGRRGLDGRGPRLFATTVARTDNTPTTALTPAKISARPHPAATRKEGASEHQSEHRQPLVGAAVTKQQSGAVRSEGDSDGVEASRRFQGFISVGSITHVLVNSHQGMISHRLEPDSASPLSLLGRQLFTVTPATMTAAATDERSGLMSHSAGPDHGGLVGLLSSAGTAPTGILTGPHDSAVAPYRLVPGRRLPSRVLQLLDARLPVVTADLSPSHAPRITAR